METWRPKVTGRRAIPYIKTEDINGIATIVVHQDGQQGNKKVFPAKNASQTVLSSINTIDFRHILAAKQEMQNAEGDDDDDDDDEDEDDDHNGTDGQVPDLHP